MGTNQYMQLGNTTFQGTQATLQLYNAYRLNKQLKGMDDTYRIPTEISQNLTQANHAALQGLPQEQKQNYLNELEKSNSYSDSSFGDLNAGLRGIAGANEQFNQGYDKLLGADSAARMANEDKLYGVRNQMADYKDMAWSHNVDMPYQKTEQKKDAYFTAAGRQASQTSSNLAGSSAFGGSGKQVDNTGTPDTKNPYNGGYGSYNGATTSYSPYVSSIRQPSKQGLNNYSIMNGGDAYGGGSAFSNY